MTAGHEPYLLVDIASQRWALPVTTVREVPRACPVTPVRGAPAGIAGFMQLRGRVMMAISLPDGLSGVAGLGDTRADKRNVIVAAGDTLYSLLVDQVHDVVVCDSADAQVLPPHLPESWQDVSTGICRWQGDLVLILDINRLLLRLQGRPHKGNADEKMFDRG